MGSISVNPAYLKRLIDEVRNDIGRDVTFYTESLAACYLCAASGYYDTLGDISFYTTCPVCAGVYWLNSPLAHEILARVHWVNDEAITATPGGKYFLGEASLHIEPKYLSIAEDCQKATGKVNVDGHDMQISKIVPLGAPTINRYRVILKNMGDRPAG
jgi:hypothetical protein